jgi:hypothetical protein
MTKKAFDQIKQGLDEALAFARGAPGAKLHVLATQLSVGDAEMKEACEYLLNFMTCVPISWNSNFWTASVTSAMAPVFGNLSVRSCGA